MEEKEYFVFPSPQDECSFVSLRDVERAMIVFKYFYNKMALFGPLMDKQEEQNVQHEVHEEVNTTIKVLVI